MTNSQVDGTTLVVVDGSNIATEGRSVPSLTQLNDAVLALTSEFPDITVTVVVDATFGHRIDKAEVSEFDEAVAHNELVTPPAGAIGRGDAFVLSIANKVGARIFSNDSFQEFHGVYSWLFDEGRLIGGKPVPHVGWVFVNRVPVKGPVSRKARGAGKESGGSGRTASRLASLPMPIPTSPPPGRAAAKAAASAADASAPASGRGRRRKGADSVEAVPATGKDAVQPTPAAAPAGGGPVNDLLPFLEFVEHNPVGTAVTATVETYSSHGAYVKIGDVRGYVPLRLMGTPPPRSAREVMRLGDDVALVVTSFAPPRRSIDLAVPGVADVAPVAAETAPKLRGRKAAAASAPESTVPTPEAPPEAPPESTRRRRGAAAEQAAPAVEAKPAARSRRAKGSADAAPDGTPSPKRAKRGTASGQPVAATAPAEKSSTEKSPAKASAAKKAPAETSAARTSAAKKTPAKTSASKTSGAGRESGAAKKSMGAQPSTDAASPADAAASPAPAKRGRAAKAAASVAATSPGTSARRAATTASAPTGDGTHVERVEHAAAPAAPAPRWRRSNPTAGD